MENAIKKINEQMQENPTDVYTEIIGQYIIDRCVSPEVASEINNGKTLSGALDAVKAAARAKAKNGVGVVSDSEVFDAVDKYLAAKRDDKARQKSKAAVDGDSVSESKPHSSNSLDIDFESLI